MNKKALVESALFISDKPISASKLSEITGLSAEDVMNVINEIKAEHLHEKKGMELVETPEGYEFRIKPQYRDKIVKLAPMSDLTEGQLRTLALTVALKPPVKQSAIVRYQGNKAYGYIEQLEKKGLIKTEKFSRTKVIKLTDEFEKYFGKSVGELKKLIEGGESKSSSS
ncbi:MAG: SMC-Scp complex subunit ScpB [Candidatus Aenigmarchaeota archaeon]|nr:SMC-Scp complex subunit ScpB [Candidatus Aenigmarchaeota archaeon]